MVSLSPESSRKTLSLIEVASFRIPCLQQECVGARQVQKYGSPVFWILTVKTCSCTSTYFSQVCLSDTRTKSSFPCTYKGPKSSDGCEIWSIGDLSPLLAAILCWKPCLSPYRGRTAFFLKLTFTGRPCLAATLFFILTAYRKRQKKKNAHSVRTPPGRAEIIADMNT